MLCNKKIIFQCLNKKNLGKLQANNTIVIKMSMNDSIHKKYSPGNMILKNS